MCMCEQWRLQGTSQWAFKMTEQVEQQICIEFCIKLEHSCMETIRMIQKATYMGNCWLAASSQQCARTCIMSCAEFFGETSNHPGDPTPYSSDWVPCDFWLFPKLKSPLKGKRFQTINEIQENMTGKLMVIQRENCVRSQGAYSELDWDAIVLCAMYLVSSINVSIFS